MNLYISIMVEPKDKIPKGTTAGGQFMSALGGIPRGESQGPWREDQCELIETAIKQWYANKPTQVTDLHQNQRDSVLSQFEQGDYGFLFSFSTGDAIDLDCFQKDTEQLYLALELSCKGTDMIATKFDSV